MGKEDVEPTHALVLRCSHCEKRFIKLFESGEQIAAWTTYTEIRHRWDGCDGTLQRVGYEVL
jgi:hypothetical protein